MKYADQIKMSEADLETAKQKANNANTTLKKAQVDLKKLKDVVKENDDLKANVKPLEDEAAQAQVNFKATLEVEQNLLVADNKADSDTWMKITWDALYPG